MVKMAIDDQDDVYHLRTCEFKLQPQPLSSIARALERCRWFDGSYKYSKKYEIYHR